MNERTAGPNLDVCAERIARLEAELASSKRQLDDTLREFDAFAYSISHDLRGPLRVLNGFARLLNDDARLLLTGDAAGYLDRIAGATRRLELLLDDLLILSRASRATLQVQTLDLGAMAGQIAASLDAGEPGRGVAWQIAETAIQADPILLRSALVQLLGNAFKFTRTREQAVIELIAEPSAADRSATVAGFSIRDNGVGFDMSFADRLFAPFQRMHPASHYEGNGIGLALVQRIVRRHGGRIWLHSAPEQGTQVFVRLWETEPPPGAAS